MLKPINALNKCRYCIPVRDFDNTMGYGCEYFNDGVTVLGDTPCDIDDYNKCPYKERERKLRSGDRIIYETRIRSLLKAVSFRVIEVVIDTVILSFFVDVHIALVLSLVVEFTCFIVHYIFERLWNRINYGRYSK